MAGNYLWKNGVFRNVTACNNFSKVSRHFKKIANFCRHIADIFRKTKQSVERDFKVLEKSLKTVLDDAHVMVNLYSLPDKPFLYPGKSSAPSEAEKLLKFPLL